MVTQARFDIIWINFTDDNKQYQRISEFNNLVQNNMPANIEFPEWVWFWECIPKLEPEYPKKVGWNCMFILSLMINSTICLDKNFILVDDKLLIKIFD